VKGAKEGFECGVWVVEGALWVSGNGGVEGERALRGKGGQYSAMARRWKVAGAKQLHSLREDL
jgi:hypothetical protein